MPQSPRSTFQLQRLTPGATPIAGLGIASLIAAAVGAGSGAALSIRPGGGAPLPSDPRAGTDCDWSAWVSEFGKWRSIAFGGASLNEIAPDILACLINPGFGGEEIRICPPGTLWPVPM